MKKIPGFLVALLLFVHYSFAQSITDTARKKLLVPQKALSFLAMGDWGRDGEYNQKETALQMGVTAKELEPDFIVALGDNFYPSGVGSAQDHRWVSSYENIYSAHSLQTDWYVTLGNHDYKGNVQAQIDYSKISRRWHMPARYFAKKFAIDGDTTQQVLLVCLDTSPFITQYYSSPDHRDQVKGQDTTAQKKWLIKTLSDPSPNIKWRIVTGHHPLYTGSKRMNTADTKQLNASLKPVFDKYKVDAYICGHDHSLQYIKPEGMTNYFVSGAGSETTASVIYPGIGKFAASVNGFMAFSITLHEMLVQVIDLNGNILYQDTIKK